jgi:hypothetical protein
MFEYALSCLPAWIVVVASSAVLPRDAAEPTTRLVEAANRHFQAGSKLLEEARPEFGGFFQAVRSFPENRPALQKQARQLSELYARCAGEYRQAAATLEEAAQTTTDADVAAYLTAKSRLWAKTAEVRRLLGGFVLIVCDPAVGTPDELRRRQEPLELRIHRLHQEEKQLDTRTEQIFDEHRAKFDLVPAAK